MLRNLTNKILVNEAQPKKGTKETQTSTQVSR